MTTILRLPALEICQGPRRKLYTFAVDGKALPSFTTVSRIFRGAEQKVEGYQRPEVLSHIAEIREYIESEDSMIPNVIVVAFDQPGPRGPLLGLPDSETLRRAVQLQRGNGLDLYLGTDGAGHR
jgi:hypothetical protein